MDPSQTPQGRGSRMVALLLALVPVLLVTLLYYQQNAFLEGFEARTYDLRFKSLRGPIPVHPDIAIIAIDDKSIQALGRFPWTRQHYVRLLERLEAAKPKVLLFDVFFPEAESAEVDEALAEAIRRAGNVVLATTFEFDRQFRVVGSTGSLPRIERAAAGIAHINLIPEEDGVNRRNLLMIERDGQAVPSLGLAAAMRTLGEPRFTSASFRVQLGERSIPVGPDGELWINYTGTPGNYPRYAFVDVVEGRVDPALLRGKTVFLGATALGVYDMRVTPFHANTPGVEVHAAVADDILSQRYIHRTGLQSLFDLAMIVALGGIAFALTARLRLHRAIPAVLALGAAYLGLSYWLFLQGQWVSMVYPPLAALLALLLGGGWRYMVLERSAREMRAMFSSYLSNKLVSQLERNPGAARIGGDNREVTVMFTDIKGFTAFSERHKPQVVVARLNEYLAAMVQLIYQHDGTVDKFMGDGIMAYWGAPLSQPDHARRAVACALAMKELMVELGERWRAQGLEPFVIRGGIQSGDVVAGNIGSRGQKMEYTVIGDTVNQASRLEGMAKYFGVDFVVGDETYLKTCDSFRFRRLDRVRVAGKDIPVAIHELRGAVQAQEDRLETLFAAALGQFRQQQWEAAETSFLSILADYPNDIPSRLYLERCLQFKAAPAGPEWDGVFNRQDK
ncbi:MAG: CHASE2 domain-containing protein [Hylemonella sp.]|uniref:CHASE2 domain-containing protein n=1 Tax=Hylemonella sp. TaxID=2066020 RepID=UPI0022C23C10|nr:CHASE2 domain-containing protein [Hylemonella sp.]MCZ8250835.1 CHASE2 domain-containing protein [Hylemonella sp.]